MSPLEAKKIIDSLARGISPDTGEILAEQSELGSPRVILALQEASRALKSAATRQRRKNSLPGNAGKPWTDTECAELLAAFDAGTKVDDIALNHGRTPRGIAARLVHLGRLKEQGGAYARATKTAVHAASFAPAPAQVRAKKTIVEKIFSADDSADSSARTESQSEPGREPPAVEIFSRSLSAAPPDAREATANPNEMPFTRTEPM